MNENVPSLKTIQYSFSEHCFVANGDDKHTCDDCRYRHVADYDYCKVYHAHDVLTGKKKLTDNFEKPKPEPEKPAWCRAGQWVTESHPAHRIGVIDGIFSDGRVWVIWFHNADGCTGSNTLTKYLKPVRFREYTFEEAKGLLGKVIEYNWGGTTPVASIIRTVSRDNSDIHYNGASFAELQHWGATIDGVPVGVPEVDEEALKGGKE